MHCVELLCIESKISITDFDEFVINMINQNSLKDDWIFFRYAEAFFNINLIKYNINKSNIYL